MYYVDDVKKRQTADSFSFPFQKPCKKHSVKKKEKKRKDKHKHITVTNGHYENHQKKGCLGGGLHTLHVDTHDITSQTTTQMSARNVKSKK